MSRLNLSRLNLSRLNRSNSYIAKLQCCSSWLARLKRLCHMGNAIKDETGLPGTIVKYSMNILYYTNVVSVGDLHIFVIY